MADSVPSEMWNATPWDNGIERIELQVFASNERAIALYPRPGVCRRRIQHAVVRHLAL